MGNLYNALLYEPILKVLIFLYGLLGNNFGWAIIALTVLIRLILVPITLPALRSARAMQDLKPALDRLKKKYGKDKKRLQEEQLKLYREKGINPAVGCLPYLVQFLILIALYRVFMFFLQTGKINGETVSMNFFWLNLVKPDPSYVLPVLAGISQMVMSLMITPAPAEVARVEEKAKEPAKKAEDTEEMAMAMQKQMIFLMPAMTVFIGLRLPSGLALYWVVTTIFSSVQQYFISGWGSLTRYLKWIKPKK